MRDRETYRVKKIFGPTIQGEGTHAGTVVSFVRFAGCNRWTGLEKDKALAFCRFCDTDFRGGESMSVSQILGALHALGGPKRVVLSGGEPTLQINERLLENLKHNGYEIHLETNGSMPLGRLFQYIDHVTVSPKQDRAETRLEYADAIKLLYPLPEPFMDPSRFVTYPARQHFLQPVMEEGKYEGNVSELLDYVYRNPSWRVSLQTHKILEVE